MTINGINYLLMERRGCNYRHGDESTKNSDVGNYRVFVEFTDKNGVRVCGDFTSRNLYRFHAKNGRKLKKPVIVHNNALCVNLQYEDERGAWGYNHGINTDEYTYNLSDIIAFVNAISAEHYDAVKWVVRLEEYQEAGKNFTPASKIIEHCKRHKIETYYKYDSLIVKLYTGEYKYMAYQIDDIGSGKERIEFTLEEA